MSAMELYRIVMEDVLKNVKEDFIKESNEQTFAQLQNLWETKLIQSGVIGVSANSTSIPQEIVSFAQNVSASSNSTTITKSITDIVPTTTSTSISSSSAISSTKASTVNSLTPRISSPSISELISQLNPSTLKRAAPTPHTAPPFSKSLGNIFNVSFDGKPSLYMPPPPSWTPPPPVSSLSSRNTPRRPKKSKTDISQFDGADDEKIEDEEELDSSLDDDDVEPQTEHLVLCQFEKIKRIKNKRKCVLKDGIMHLNGRDYVFSKAIGECEF